MIKSFLIYFPSIMLPRLVGLLIILAGTRILSPDQYGYFSLVMFIGEFTEGSISIWTRIALVRFGASTAGISRAFAGRMAWLAAACTITAVLMSSLVVSYLAPEKGLSIVIAVSFYIISVAIVRFGVSLHQASENMRFISVVESVRSALVLGAVMMAMYWSKEFLWSSLATSLVNLCVGGIAATTGMQITRTGLPNKTAWSTILSFAGPLIILAFLSLAITNLDKAMLKSYQDAATLGYYAAAFAIGRSGFDVVASSFNTGTFVKLATMFNEGRQKETSSMLSRQMGSILAISFPAMGTLFASRELLAKLLLPSTYSETFVTVIPFIAVGAIAMNLKNFVYDNIFHMRLQNLRQIPTLVVGAAVTTTIGFSILPKMPIVGAGLMFATGAIAALLMTVALTWRLMRVNIPWKSVCISAILGLIAWYCAEQIQISFSGTSNLVLLAAITLIMTCLLTTSLIWSLIAMRTQSSKFAIAFITANPDRVTGLSSYSESLIGALAQHSDGQEIILFTNVLQPIMDRLRLHPNLQWVQLPARPKYLPYKLYVLLMHQYASARAGLMGCQSYLSTTPLGALIPLVSQIVTLHDLYDFDHRFRPWRTIFYSYLIWPWTALVSKNVVCVSQTTKADALKYMVFAATKMVVIKEASKFSPVGQKSPLEPLRFLFVANVQPTKNVECLLAALRRSELGNAPIYVDWVGWDVVGIIKNWVKQNGTVSNFKALGSLLDHDLAQRYQEAVGLIVPSWKEGFCLPVLEAHSFGVPVIASDIPTLREVCGDGAIFFDPARPDTLLEAMHQLLNDHELRQKLRDAASENALQYSWEKAAEQTQHLVLAKKVHR